MVSKREQRNLDKASAYDIMSQLLQKYLDDGAHYDESDGVYQELLKMQARFYSKKADYIEKANTPPKPRQRPAKKGSNGFKVMSLGIAESTAKKTKRGTN